MAANSPGKMSPVSRSLLTWAPGRGILTFMNQLAWIIPSVLSVAALGGVVVQSRHITALEARVAAPQEAPDDTSAELATLTARVAQLERQRAVRVVAAPSAPAESPPAGAAAAPVPTNVAAELKQLREDVDALLTGEATATEQGQARLRAVIADTQQRQWAEREEHRDQRILQQLTDEAHLNQGQRDDLAKALEAERTQRRTLLAGARSGDGQGRPEDVRSALQALRAQTDQRARSLLSAEQYTKYEASRTFGRGPRGGGGGGRGQPQ